MGYEVLWGVFIGFLRGWRGFCFWVLFETETNLVFDTEVLKDQLNFEKNPKYLGDVVNTDS